MNGTCPICSVVAEPTLAEARAVGIVDQHWPYGPNSPENTQMRVDLVRWAAEANLKLARPRNRCLHWVIGKARTCSQLPGTDERHHFVRGSALDHATFWTRGGKPCFVLAQVNNVDQERLDQIKEAWPVEISVQAAPWYNTCSTGIFIMPKVDWSK